MITVAKLDEHTFNVTVAGQSTTTHMVTVDSAYYQKLTGGRVPVEDLVKRSFEFLLDRESNTSILTRFDLPVIGHYFPEYEGVITQKI